MTFGRYTGGTSHFAAHPLHHDVTSMRKQLTVNREGIDERARCARCDPPGGASFLSSHSCSHSTIRGIRWKSSSSCSAC
ncbi:conserved hypothetical protein [Burkholderia diffusa]|nr:conserved hypothetical protein [Burkholderia diffusa]